MTRLWAELRERVRALVRRRDAEREMEDEFSFHLEMEAEELRRTGVEPDEAMRRARVAFGGTERMKEEVRDARGVRALEDLAFDLRLTFRRLVAQRGFTLVVVLTLGIGIGATTIVYGLLRGVVLAPLPYPDPQRLVMMEEITPDGSRFSVSLPNYRDFQREQRSFSHLAAVADRDVALLGTGDPLSLHAQSASAEYLPMFGIHPVLGRLPTAGEYSRGERTTVLTYALWQDRFGGTPDVLQRAIVLDGEPYSVAGVMPRDFETPGEPALWLPLANAHDAEREDHDLMAIGRLAEGVAIEAAESDLARIATRLGEAYPETNSGWSVQLTSLRERMVGESWPRAAWILMSAVGLLLLLTCVNVASLLLARSLERGRELSLRLALGASRGRLVRQLLTESLVLSGLGALAGIAIAVAFLPLVREALPADTPRLAGVKVEPTMMFVSLALALAVGLMFGMAPAIRAARMRAREALADHARGERPGAGRVREALVATEIALAALLLAGAGFLGTSLLRLQAVDTGFDTAGVLVVPLSLTSERYADGGVQRMVNGLEERLGSLSSVSAVGTSNVTPFGTWGTVVHLSVEGRPSGPGQTTFASWRAVTPGFFSAAGLRLLRGRLLEKADHAPDAPDRIVVTETFANRLFPESDALGKRVAMGVNGTNWREIVGVVEDVRDLEVEQLPAPLFFLPGIGNWANVTLLLRAPGQSAAISPAVRAVIAELDPDLPVPAIEPLADRVRRSTAGPRFYLQVMSGFAFVALLLAAMGVYGTMSYTIARRTKEFGIRLALGARPGSVRRLVLRRAAVVAMVGLTTGTVAAVLLSSALGSMLYESPGVEPLTLAIGAVVLAAVVVLAALIPARRVARISAMRALRVDG